jgi:hypothetical protein
METTQAMPVVVHGSAKVYKDTSCGMVFWSAKYPLYGLFQDAQHSTCGIILENWRVAREPAILIHQCV